QKDLAESSVKTAIAMFPTDFKTVVNQLLHNDQTESDQVQDQDQPVVPVVAQQRFEHHNRLFPGTAALKCVRRDNKLVSKVINDNTSPKMSTLQGVIKATHDPFCNGTQHAHTSNSGLEIVCDACSFRFPEMQTEFLTISEKRFFPALSNFLVQVNNNTTNNITVNNYHAADSLQLDVQFDKIEPIFPDEDVNRIMFHSFNALASDIGSVIYELGKHQFAYAHASPDPWWAFSPDTGQWSQSSIEIRHFCKNTVAALYYTAKLWYLDNTSDPKLSRDCSVRFDNIIKRLKDKDLPCVLQMAVDDFVRNAPNLLAKLNTQKDLLGFTDGVYDLSKGEFHPASPEDYLTLCTGYPFPREANPEIQSKIMAFFELILPSHTEVTYMLKFLANALNGYNCENIFTIWTGTGRNGKGVLADLLAAALAVELGYFHSIRAALLTLDPPNANSPVPEILNLIGKRIAMGSEPEKGSSIKSGMLKLLTGNDRLSGRALFSNKEISFEPQHTIILQTNAIPKLDASDHALWKRCRIIEFVHEFVKNPTRPNERKINLFLREEVKTWGPQFMFMLLDWYKVYLEEGIQPTQAMLVKAVKTRADNDHFLCWVMERIVAIPGKHVHNRTAREDYYQWCKNNSINIALTRREFGQRMNPHFPLLDGQKREFKMEGVTDAGVRNYSLALMPVDWI
ncbi:hypothetical protein HDU81_008726, partial [Chytriomyces hyalinus]